MPLTRPRSMNNRDNHCAVTEIVSLDKTKKTDEALAIQKNIDKAVQKRHYDSSQTHAKYVKSC